MKSLISAALLSATLATTLSGAAFASDSVALTDEMKTKITETLTAQGYEVGKIKIEDGLYEAYAKKDGMKYEIFLDGDLNVVKTEED
ncbi:PepSY domain-containing protein [Celeribacter ethanolicus]|uniref:PepSY domain-containing protein n=1 Tax=Celeribacter ethanolicus TaxID=1758178 RepID=A0A291G8T6_9RHOB|nr:PepSY domain-containing protein [Celeribacter ethanolicus]ATG46585.1 PepSY domain-containing protein [Celeribacter ethanolicus]TNE69159.1 MAG: PepSY domain-containing protein [Paracoccaceae bacterium]